MHMGRSALLKLNPETGNYSFQQEHHSDLPIEIISHSVSIKTETS
jgi:hypothetical protein